MFPAIPTDNMVDGNIVNIKLPGQLLLISPFGIGPPKPTNLLDLLLGKFRVGIAAAWQSAAGRLSTKFSKGMEVVLACRHYFKVLKSIIATNAVFVVHLQALWNWANKCYDHQAMNYSHLHFTTMAKSYTKIASIAGRFQDAPWLGVVTTTSNALHATCIRYFINALIARNGLPSFHCVPPLIGLEKYTMNFQLCQKRAEET